MGLHSRWRLVRMAMLALAVVAWLAPNAGAADKRPLPSSLVQSVDGAPMPLDHLVAEGQWLVIYVLPDSTAAGRLLDALGQWELPTLGRIRILVGGAPAAATAFAKRDRGLPELQWSLDPQQSAWKDLQITGVPALFGIKNGAIEWRLAGVLNDPTALRAVVTSWTGQSAP